MSTESKQNELKEVMNKYNEILRTKIGEYLLIQHDLKERGVTTELSKSNIDKSYITGIITAGCKEYTSSWGDYPEILGLCILMYNNGYPIQLHIKTYDTTEYLFPDKNKINDYNPIYNIHMIFGNNQGEKVNEPNHYTLEIPEELQKKVNILDELEQIANTTKYKIPLNGHCFYNAFGLWCKMYGITTDHIDKLSYNVPFEFDKESHSKNLKVKGLQGQGDNIPTPIEFNQYKKYTDLAYTIANDFKTKMSNQSLKFDEKNINDSQEYKNYLETGVTQNQETHCNKYKGNKNLTTN